MRGLASDGARTSPPSDPGGCKPGIADGDWAKAKRLDCVGVWYVDIAPVREFGAHAARLNPVSVG